MKHYFTIYGTLPNLNDYLKAERIRFTSKYGKFETQGNLMKRKAQEKIIPCIYRGIKGKVKTPIRINYHFYEPNKKRDLDNISAFAMKVVQDSLVKSGVIPNDGWSCVIGFTCQFDTCREQPRIVVELEEV